MSEIVFGGPMRLSFRITAILGVTIVLLSSIQPALAIHRSSESFTVARAFGSSAVFEQLTIEDSLSQNAGLALLQNHQGILWIGHGGYSLPGDGLTSFDPASVTADRLGLKIMSEPSEAIGAKFSLYSEPGEGTQVTVTWPAKEIL